jgi:hypothetical protein
MTVPALGSWLAIPQEIKEIPNWVRWRNESNGTGKPTKVPYCAGANQRASTTDPNTWASFDSALAGMNGQDAGLGLVLTLALCLIFIDLDHCVVNGVIQPWARGILKLIPSYAEFSPSGTGLHSFAKGNLPPGARKRGSLEMYCEKRFATVTGNHVEGTPLTIEQVDVGWLHRLMAQGVFDFAKNPKLEKLMNGEWEGSYASQSEADLALCALLAHLGLSEDDIDSAFRCSALCRNKWDEQRGDSTYGRETIRKALKNQTSKPALAVSGIELLRNGGGGTRPILQNAVTLLHHPEWKGVLGFDEFSGRTMMLKSPPGFPISDRLPRPWTDADDTLTACSMQRNDVFVNSRVAAEAVQVVALECRYQSRSRVPARPGLGWNGTD